MRHAVRGLSALVFGTVLGACADTSFTAPSDQDFVPVFSSGAASVENRYIVVFRDDVVDPEGETDRAIRAHGGQLHFRYSRALKGFAATLPPQAVEALRRNPNVAFIEADGVVTTVVTQPGATWGLDRVDQRNLPLSTSYTYDHTGSGVHAYVIDTGIRSTHNEFTGRVGNGFTSIQDGGGTADCHGHGTHVSGTIGGTVYGVAKNVTLHPVRVLNCSGSGSNSGVIAGVDWVTAHAVKPAVANMSLGGGASQALDDAVTNSVSSGVVYAVAAGNSNANACNFSPARATTALTIGSTTTTDARSSFSNFGTCVDIFAPGSAITSAWSTSNTATNTISGTSMASPHVAGVAALYLSTPGNGSATPATVATAIINNATTGVVGNAGAGSPNRLLHSLFAGSPPGNAPPTAAFTFSCTNLACSFNGSGSSDSDGTIGSYSWNFGDGTATGSGATATHTYAAGGTYSVTLTVTDDDNATDGETKNVTVSAGSGGQVEVHIGGSSAATSASGPNWRPTVTATVHNASNSPVSGATVSGTWSTGGSGSCVTGAAGTCSIQGANLKRKVQSTTFSVTGITGTNMTYNASKNTTSSIVINKP